MCPKYGTDPLPQNALAVVLSEPNHGAKIAVDTGPQFTFRSAAGRAVQTRHKLRYNPRPVRRRYLLQFNLIPQDDLLDERSPPVQDNLFMNQGKIYEIYARSISHGDLFGFIEVDKLVFGERTSVVVDPSEERIKSEFEGVQTNLYSDARSIANRSGREAGRQ